MQDSRKKVLAIDFDDVVMNFHAEFMAYSNRLFGTNLVFEELYLYDDWEKLYGCDKDTIVERAKEFYLSPYHAKIKPVNGAKEALGFLAQKYSLQIVTSRPNTAQDITVKWIDQFFPDTFSNIYFTNSFAGATGAAIRKKSEVCREIGAVVLIDDAIKHVRDVAESGLPALMPDRPWNRTETPPGSHRIYSWQEAVDWIENNV